MRANPVQRLDQDYDEFRDRNVPRIEETAIYVIKNRGFSPVSLSLTNTLRNAIETKTLGSREEIEVEGSRMTQLIWELERRNLITVKVREQS